MEYYYVYIFYNEHIPIYVGYGKNMRWKVHFSMDTNIRLNRFLKKNSNNEPKIIADKLSIEDAKNLEKQLIAEYGRLDLKTGSLYNLTDGGDGTSGLIMTDEQKKSISNGAKKRWLSKEQRDKHSMIMQAATNSDLFKQRVLARRPSGWVSSKDRKKVEKKNAADDANLKKMAAIQLAFSENDQLEIMNVTGIKTSSGLKRFLKRHGFIEK